MVDDIILRYSSFVSNPVLPPPPILEFQLGGDVWQGDSSLYVRGATSYGLVKSHAHR